MTSEVFKKYYKKIGRESILKALLCGLTIGFSLMFVCIAASWLAGFKAGIYIGLGLFGRRNGDCDAAVLYVQIPPYHKEDCAADRYAGAGRENPDDGGAGKRRFVYRDEATRGRDESR